MSAEERQKYEQLLRKRTSVMRKNVSDETRRKYQKVGRLRLEDALKQMRDDPDAAMEGWSEARKKAWKAIDKNPNSYYYRFNAPNEEQRTGQWTPHEQKLFHERLAELGANGQWGVFSMTIPGRVGYQLVETNQIQDSNYVLDEKGKAHYLFSTKDGRKTFRTHCKHRRDGTSGPVGRSRRRKASEDEDENEYENGGEPDVTTADLSSEPVVKSKAKIKAEETADALPTAAAKRPRRRRVKRASDDYGSSNDSDDDWMHGRERDGDASGDYRSSAGGYGTTKRARAMNSRRAAAALTETSMNVDISSDARLCSSPIASPTSEDVASGMHNIALSDVIVNSGGGRVANGSINPLPGYIDPITLEEVIKPAISPFGHVMGYDNWVRCLTRSEPRNVCPITKNPLSKRDLVVLTPDNIEDYRARIISM